MSGATNKQFSLLLAATCTLGLLAGALAYQALPPSAEAQPEIPGLLWPDPKPLTEFSLQDQNGVRFDHARLKNKWTFMFFGYTHCPDVCPNTLVTLKNVKDILRSSPEISESVQVVFVSVDPERDTPDHIADYLGYFDSAFVGATGNKSRLDELTRQLGVLYIHEKPDSDGVYLVDHTASIMLLDPKVRLISVFGAPHRAAEIAARLKKIVDFVQG